MCSQIASEFFDVARKLCEHSNSRCLCLWPRPHMPQGGFWRHRVPSLLVNRFITEVNENVAQCSRRCDSRKTRQRTLTRFMSLPFVSIGNKKAHIAASTPSTAYTLRAMRTDFSSNTWVTNKHRQNSSEKNAGWSNLNGICDLNIRSLSSVKNDSVNVPKSTFLSGHHVPQLCTAWLLLPPCRMLNPALHSAHARWSDKPEKKNNKKCFYFCHRLWFRVWDGIFPLRSSSGESWNQRLPHCLITNLLHSRRKIAWFHFRWQSELKYLGCVDI